MDKIADLAVGYLKGILELFGETSSSIDEYDGDNGELILDVNGGDLAVLIGRHGRTLDALQMVLTSLMSSRIKFYYPIVVDIEGYKSRRKRKLEDIARSSAERAKRRHGKVTLAPMNAYERQARSPRAPQRRRRRHPLRGRGARPSRRHHRRLVAFDS